jgi:hypothetical protein
LKSWFEQPYEILESRGLSSHMIQVMVRLAILDIGVVVRTPYDT